MGSIAFWKSWHRPYQLVFWLFALILFLSVIYFWYAYANNPAPVITWEHYQQLNTEEVRVRTFSTSLFEIPVYGDNFTVYEILGGSELRPNTGAFYFFLITFSVSFLVLITIASSLSRFWFIVSMGVLCVFIMTFGLESLQVAGLGHRIFPIAVIILFIALAYFFHAIKTESNFITRFLSFGILYLLLMGVIFFLASVQDPLMHLSVNGFALAVLITAVFIMMVAHEIPAAFIQLITQGTRQSKSMQHFLVIIGFYLLNLLITYGIKIGYIQLNIWVINLFLLFSCSAILGIWGFRQREPQYENILQANPDGVYFILGMAIMSFGTLGYFMATANDTILIVFKDLIIYSHLGYGIIFLFYVISNFGSMLTKNLQVYKVLYKPTTMPYFTFRLMGLICTFAFLVFDTNWRTPFNQVFASYQNSYGDLYLAQGNIEMAQSHYNKSVLFRNQNHHAHYALANIHAAKLEPAQELDEWRAAGDSYPCEQTILNLSDAYRRAGKTSEALMAMEKASANLTDHAAILNAKGMIYSQLKMPDSALMAFQQARQFNYMKDAAETNLLAVSVRFKLAHPADSLLMLLGSDKQGAKTNALALANLQHLPIQMEFTLGNDTSLSATKAAFICNYFVNQRESVDTTYLRQAIELARRPVNDAFKEYILIASAQAYYAQGRVKYAFELAREVAYRTGSGKYFLLLANWALEQGNPEIAAGYFSIAKEKQQPAAVFHEALAQTEAKNFLEARILWDSLNNSADTLYRPGINRIMAALTTSAGQVSSLDDESTYLYCRYRIPLEDSTQFLRVVNSISNEEVKARAIVEYSRKWYSVDEPQIAARFLSLLEGLTPSRESTMAEFYLMNCMLLADSKNWEELNRQIGTIDLLKKYFRNEIIYWQALMDEKDGKKEQARQKYEYLGNANMYFEEGVVAAAKFFINDTTVDRLKPYSMLVNGLLVKPNSVKLLKAYIKEAAILGFDDEAAESLEKLKAIMPLSSFNRYVKENPDFFDIE